MRLIPASAGSTAWGRCVVLPRTAHPRVCGEHSRVPKVCLCTTGSSPRLRGALPQTVIGAVRVRLIPASAGSTYEPDCSRGPTEAHPRVCGEHVNRIRMLPMRQGSSPRLRGARVGAALDGPVAGLIPASAGSTKPSCPSSWRSEAHPRVCGEHSCPHMKQWLPVGSSPRLRGARAFPLA